MARIRSYQPTDSYRFPCHLRDLPPGEGEQFGANIGTEL